MFNYRTPLPFAWVLLVLFTIWVLYVLYKVCQHVGAWPFA